MKKKILIASYNESNLVDFFYSGFINELQKNFDIEFIFEKNFDTKKYNYKKDYFKYIENFNSKTVNNSSNIYSKIKTRLFELAFYFDQIKKFTEIKRYKSYVEAIDNTLCIDHPSYKNFFNFLFRFRIFSLVHILINFLRIVFNAFFKKELLNKKYDLILFAWKIIPFSYFYEDIILEAKKKEISTLGIQLNWDNIPDRYHYNVPEYLSVIGQQSFDYLFTTYSISPHRVFVNGSLKIESQKNTKKIDKNLAKKKLNLPSEKKIICFAPSGDQFDEIFIMKTLNKLKTTKKLDNIIFYVKGYKGGKIVTIKDSLKNEYKKNIEDDKFTYENLIFWEPNDLNLTEKEYFENFYSAIDGLISTYSSVVLEGAFHGVPSVGLNYNPKEYGLHIKDNWFFKNYWPHTYSFRNHEVVKQLEISSREEIETKIINFIEILNNNNLSELFKKISYLNVQNYDGNVNIKILKIIKDIINNDISENEEKKIFH